MSDQLSTNHKRLAKNTMILYGRTILILFIGLFTSRVILDALGVEDYGVYNVVGGFVSMFSIVSHTLTSTTQRFLNYELGKKDEGRSNQVFGAAMTIHVVLSVVLILLLESVGLWFLNTQLNIDTERMTAANIVYQCSIFTFVFNILSQPYNAAIIAHERMNVFAYISLVDVLLKLAIVYLLYLSSADKLIVYALLLMIESTLIRSVYAAYCKRHFKETQFLLVKDIAIYKEITGFASLNFIGVLASVLRGQGINILLNIFFGVVVNAARGIANQVNHAVMKFVDDFMTSLRPQITKSCAAGNIREMRDLCYKGTRFSFYLVLIFSIPILLKTEYILRLWLRLYPEDAVIFVRLTLILSLCTVLSKTTINAILASGQIKRMTFLIGSVNLLSLPICYIVLSLGGSPSSVYVIAILMELVLLTIRLFVLRGLLDFPIMGFVKNVMLYVIIVLVISTVSNFMISKFFEDNIFQFFAFVVISLLITGIVSFIFGMKRGERNVIVQYVKKINRK